MQMPELWVHVCFQWRKPELQKLLPMAKEALKILLPILQAMLEAYFPENEAVAYASHAILPARRGASHTKLQPTCDHFLAILAAIIELDLARLQALLVDALELTASTIASDIATTTTCFLKVRLEVKK